MKTLYTFLISSLLVLSIIALTTLAVSAQNSKTGTLTVRIFDSETGLPINDGVEILTDDYTKTEDAHSKFNADNYKSIFGDKHFLGISVEPKNGEHVFRKLPPGGYVIVVAGYDLEPEHGLGKFVQVSAGDDLIKTFEIGSKQLIANQTEEDLNLFKEACNKGADPFDQMREIKFGASMEELVANIFKDKEFWRMRKAQLENPQKQMFRTEISTIPECRQFISNNPNNKTMKYQLGRLLWAVGRSKELSSYSTKTSTEYIDEALDIFEKLSSEGYWAATKSAVSILIERANYKKAFTISKNLTDKDDAGGQFTLSYLYQNGIGVEKDDNLANSLLLKAASQRHSLASYTTAAYLDKGYISYSDKKINVDSMAIKYYRIASEEKNPLASYQLGLRYKYGLGIKQDPEKAFDYFIESGFASDIAAAEIGWAFMEGRGVSKNMGLAYRWLERAMNTGNELAAIHWAALLGTGQKYQNWTLTESEWETSLEKLSQIYESTYDQNIKTLAISFYRKIKSNPPRSSSNSLSFTDLVIGIAAAAILLGAIMPNENSNYGGTTVQDYSGGCDGFSTTDPCSPAYWETFVHTSNSW